MALNMTLYNIFASPLMYVIISDIDVSVQSTISTTVTATFLEKSRTKRFQCKNKLRNKQTYNGARRIDDRRDRTARCGSL